MTGKSTLGAVVCWVGVMRSSSSSSSSEVLSSWSRVGGSASAGLAMLVVMVPDGLRWITRPYRVWTVRSVGCCCSCSCFCCSCC